MDKIFKKANRLTKKKKVVIGSVSDNKPYVKVMLIAKREGIKTFYFASNNSSLRAKHFQENPFASLYFYGGIPYKGLMLEGTAEVLNDIETKKIIWTRFMKYVYKDGISDQDFCVIKFTASCGRFYEMYKSYDLKL